MSVRIFSKDMLSKYVSSDQSCLRTDFRFLTTISIFDENFDFWRKFRFLVKILIFTENFGFCGKFRFLTKISVFDQNLGF